MFMRVYRQSVQPILVIIIAMTVVRSSMADWNDVPTGSMNPTIVEGDRIFVNKMAYTFRLPMTSMVLSRWGRPAVGDIIVFEAPDSGRRLVKRVAAVGGDILAMRNNILLINGVEAEYAPLDPASSQWIRSLQPDAYTFRQEQLAGHEHAVMAQPDRVARRSFAAIRVPEGSVFVLGDNRDNSRDSRYFGFVPESAIFGRAECVIFSLDYSEGFRPRSGRYLHRLD